MTKAAQREQRRMARQAKERRQRIIIWSVAGVIVLLIVFFVGRDLLNNQTSESSADTATGLVTTASGLQYQDLVVGEGPAAQNGDVLSVHYTGWLEDGTQFDSSIERGQPIEVTLGAGGVIPGWEEGLVGMQAGGKRQLIIPPDLAYGASGAGDVIPPNATLTFDVELLEIK